MQAWLVAQGQGADFILADHSGLSPASRITAQGMARLLAGPGLAAGLPDLLKPDPLDEDLGPDARGAIQVRAKTGTLNFVSNLAGYVTGTSGTEGVFTIFCADAVRRRATIGEELPAGVSTWTRQAKALQADLLNSFAGRLA